MTLFSRLLRQRALVVSIRAMDYINYNYNVFHFHLSFLTFTCLLEAEIHVYSKSLGNLRAKAKFKISKNNPSFI